MRVLSIVLFLFFISCNSPSQKINNFEEKVIEAKEKEDKLSNSEWQELEKSATEFEEYFEAHKNEMTPEERKKANKTLGKFRLLQIKQNMKEFKGDLEDIANQLEGLTE